MPDGMHRQRYLPWRRVLLRARLDWRRVPDANLGVGLPGGAIDQRGERVMLSWRVFSDRRSICVLYRDTFSESSARRAHTLTSYSARATSGGRPKRLGAWRARLASSHARSRTCPATWVKGTVYHTQPSTVHSCVCLRCALRRHVTHQVPPTPTTCQRCSNTCRARTPLPLIEFLARLAACCADEV